MAAPLSAAAPVLTTGPRKGLWKDFPANPYVLPLGRHQVWRLRCVLVLGAVSAQTGGQLGSKCRELVGGLTAAACFCTTIKESVLGIPMEWTWTVGVGLLASTCKKELPHGFKCNV